MAKTRSEINNAYAKKAYDNLRIIVPKGRKADIEKYIANNGESLNGYVNRLIREDMNISEDVWREAKTEKE